MLPREGFHTEFKEYLKITKPKENLLVLFKEIFITAYKERMNDFKSDDLRKEEECKKLIEEKQEVGRKGAQGIYPDLTLKELLTDYEKKILIAQNELKELSHKELDLGPMLDKGFTLIRTLEKGWQAALPERKPKLQKLVFPEGVAYQYGGFSNSRLALCFAVINDFEVQSYTNVTPGRLELPT